MPDLANMVICETDYTPALNPIKKQEGEEWIVRNLKMYGNCFIARKHDLAKITREVGKIIKREYENGFILEVAK